jgi:hypothetical protein
MSYAYNKTLVVGATSGVIVGRRKEKLDEFEQKYGSEKVHSVVCT